MSFLYHRNYGQCLFDRGSPARARAEFVACLRLRPATPKLWWLYAASAGRSLFGGEFPLRTRTSEKPSPSSSIPPWKAGRN
jgi:hypothetical protein